MPSPAAPALDTFITPGAASTGSEGYEGYDALIDAGREEDAEFLAGWLPPECSHINTYVSTRRQQLVEQEAAAGTDGSGTDASAAAGGGGARGSPLSAEVQQWVIRWEDITLERLIGRGSFGWVSGGAGVDNMGRSTGRMWGHQLQKLTSACCPVPPSPCPAALAGRRCTWGAGRRRRWRSKC